MLFPRYVRHNTFLALQNELCSLLQRFALSPTQRAAALLAAIVGLAAPAAFAQTDPIKILFVGNSYTYGYLSTAQTYNTSTVTDENGTGYGGVPAIFKEFTVERGLNYEVHIEAVSGRSLQYHLENKSAIIGQPKWNVVVLQGLSTEATIQGASATPSDTTGNRPTFVHNAQTLEQLIHNNSAAAKVYIYETWSRADLTYEPNGPYYGEPIEAMSNEVHDGYAQALANDPNIVAIVPAGDTWLRAIVQGLAVRNPLDPTDLASGRINLWAPDDYHASNYGYYLNALLMFGKITGQDPRVLGSNELAAASLNIMPSQAYALQALAYAQLHAPTAGVVSRKSHGIAGTFDVPLTGQPAIECRRPDANGGYQLIFTLDNTLTAPGTASISQGTATPATTALGPEPNQVTVNLSNVSDAQHLIVSLAFVRNGTPTALAPTSAALDVLVGDVGGNGTVNAADVAQTKGQSGQTVTSFNFRLDVNCDGTINAADVAFIKSVSGDSLPASTNTNP